MRVNSALIRLFILGSIVGIGCRNTKSGLQDAVSADGVKGYSQPGKGFKLLDREVTESVCVTGDEGSPNDRVGSPVNPDTTVKPQPYHDPNNPNGPGSPDPSGPDTPWGPSTPSTPSTPNNPNLPPPIFPDPTVPGDPYSSPFGLGVGSMPRVRPVMAASRSNIDAGITVAKQPPAPVAKGAGLTGTSQSGGAEVTFYYVHSIKDVKTTINATYKDSTAIAGSNEDKSINADVGTNIEVSLNSRFGNSTDKVFIVMHGLKTFPLVGSDVITNPKINANLTKVLFKDAMPASEADVAASFNSFRKQCGDWYVESVHRGREAWLVAVMDRKTFDASVGGRASYGTNAGITAPGIDSAKKNMSVGADGSYSKSLMKQKVEIVVRTRGRTDLTLGNFTLEDAIERLNKILASDNTDGEGVIGLEIRPYNNVRLVIGEEEKRLGDIFTSAIAAKVGAEMDVFAKIRSEKQWSDDQASYIKSTYDWDQWSLDDNFQNGVANQYKRLLAYSAKMATVLLRCSEGKKEESSASVECVELAKKTLTTARPVVNLPEPYPQRLEFFMPTEMRDIADKKGWKSDSGGWHQYDQADSKNRCSTEAGAGFALPNAASWNRIIDGSFNYIRWQRDQNLNYTPEVDSNALSYPCGKFEGAKFWTGETDKVVEIKEGCRSAAVTKAQRFSWWVLGTQRLSRYACVRFTQRTQ